MTRTYVLFSSCVCRVPRRAPPIGARPRSGTALHLVAEPVPGLRPPLRVLLRPARTFFRRAAVTRVEYRIEPCTSALNPVRGMPFEWSLNPYMGCAHRCTFCYVRNFERRADRPWDDRYGRSLRVKANIASVLRAELGRVSWRREEVVVGAATDPYQPAEGRYKLTRGCLEGLRDARNPFHIITRGPMIVRDVDVLAEAASRAKVSVSFSIPTLDDEVWRKTEPEQLALALD